MASAAQKKGLSLKGAWEGSPMLAKGKAELTSTDAGGGGSSGRLWNFSSIFLN